MPIALAALGTAILWRRDWTPPTGVPGGALILIGIGMGETLLATAFFLYVAGAFDVVLPARRVEIGSGMALLGYLCALVRGVLAAATRTTAGALIHLATARCRTHAGLPRGSTLISSYGAGGIWRAICEERAGWTARSAAVGKVE